MSSTQVGMLYSFGRSGSTLLNQCLGCHPANAIFSEVNPAASCVEVGWQAQHWLDLLEPAESSGFASAAYPEQIMEAVARGTQRHRHIVLRDWSTLNFLPGVRPEIEPSGVLEQEYYLAQIPVSIGRLVLARRANDVFHSLRTRFPQYHRMEVDQFARCYLNFAHNVAHYPVIHLEDFCAQPTAVLPTVCAHLGCAFPEDFTEKFFAYRKCTGNITLQKRIASNQSPRITPLPPSAWTVLHPLLNEADQLLGYEID